LATIGVCVFCAAASVAALFIFGRYSNEEGLYVPGGAHLGAPVRRAAAHLGVDN